MLSNNHRPSSFIKENEGRFRVSLRFLGIKYEFSLEGTDVMLLVIASLSVVTRNVT
jgi:hypothetical protein